jgi:hypothetical protein
VLIRRLVRVAVLAALVIFAAAIGWPSRALAQTGDDVRARAESVLKQAEADDDKLELASALARYDEGRALDPGSSRAPRAEARAAMLRAHAEDHFVPYAMLERVRRDPALASDPHAVDELVRAAETFSPGLVRVEVWALGAEANAHRFERPLEAEALLRRIVLDEHADRIVVQKAARDLVTLCLARGDLTGAESAVRLAGTRADPQLARDVRRAVHRRSMHHAAIVSLVAMLLLAARAWVSAARRGEAARVRAALASMWKVALGYAAYVALGGALLASGYEADTSKPFLWLGVVLVPVLLVARAWGAAGGETRAARAGRATLCAACALGAAFLVLEAIDVALLGGFGL